jgi:hypothetical protein
MWLLDVNLNVHLIEWLAGAGIAAESALHRGWRTLRNGDLLAACVEAGFECLLTQDRLFAECAGKALREHSSVGIVIVGLPQMASSRYLEAFAEAWAVAPIRVRPGEVVFWPSAE